MEKKNAWLSYTEEDLEKLNGLNEAYKVFLSTSKTERRSVQNAVALAEKAGYVNLEKIIEEALHV